jgi:UDP:flavonoid glycosyltransferase YjiC (YdhE family)
MRIVFNVFGADGHFLPMVPLATALRAAGQDVSFVTGAEYCETVRDTGFDAIGVPLDMLSGDLEDRRAAIRDRSGVERLRYTIEMFLEQSVIHAGHLVDIFERTRPDVGVRETTAWGAWMAGELVGVPVASFDYAPAPAGLFSNVLGDLFENARAQVGLPPDEKLASLDHWLTIVGAPPRWYPPECFRPTTHLFQPPDDPIGGSLPDWFDTLPDQPTVYVTLGTVFNETPGIFDMVFESVADLKVNVVATVGQNLDPATFEPLPDHVRVERFMPQALVLPHCDAVIAHGGYGSLMGSLRHGLPIVTIPLAAADNAINASRVEQLGVGIAVTEDARSSAGIRAALGAVLEEPRYRSASRQIAGDMAALPPLTDSAALITRLATERQPILAT